MQGIGTAKVLADCGVAIGYGGYILAENSACLVEDIQQYYVGKEKVNKQRQSTVEEPLSNTHADSDKSVACMRKVGIHLHKSLAMFATSTKAARCATMCGNNYDSTNYQLKHLSEIFPVASDRPICDQVARSPKSNSAINQCVSYCCDQETSCVDAAARSR